MTRSKWIRRAELTAAALLGGLLAYCRAHAARGGQLQAHGGVGGYAAGGLYLGLALAVAAFFLASVSLYRVQRLREAAASQGGKALNAVAALGMMAAAALILIEGAPAGRLITYVQALFLALCGVTLLMRALGGAASEGAGLFSLFPVYYLCLFLLLFYRENAKNPAVITFSFDILVIVALTLAVYIQSAGLFTQGRGRQQLFFCLTAAFFTAFELCSALFYPPLVLTVPGMSLGVLVMLGAMGLYAAGGIFLPLQPAGVRPQGQDEGAIPPPWPKYQADPAAPAARPKPEPKESPAPPAGAEPGPLDLDWKPRSPAGEARLSDVFDTMELSQLYIGEYPLGPDAEPPEED